MLAVKGQHLTVVYFGLVEKTLTLNALRHVTDLLKHWRKGESKPNRDNTTTFYCILEVVVPFFTLGIFYFIHFRLLCLLFLKHFVVDVKYCSSIPFSEVIFHLQP